MSISGALSNALSGLNAASRSASVVSDNLANAATEGFGRREIELSARATGAGGGVEVSAVKRMMNLTVLTDMRGATADLAESEAQVSFLSSVQGIYGEPGTGNSLTDLISTFEAGLVTAATRPDEDARLTQSVADLQAVVTRIGDISDQIQTERARADQQIADAVDTLNHALEGIAELNSVIRGASVRGTNTAALIDSRQQLIDTVSELVPVREIDRGNGVVALVSESGMLLDGQAPVLDFQPVPIITPHHSLAGGTLSTITVDGQAIDLTRDRHLLSGGKIEGLVKVRDTLAPEAQAQIDALARDLLERVSATGVDPTVPAGQPGLLTDGGFPFAAANEVGLSERLALNAAVDPAAGGASWRLRDGLGATVVGNVGDASGLQRLSDALSAVQVPGSTSVSGVARSAVGLAGDVLSAIGVQRSIIETTVAYAQSRQTSLSAELAADGVDSDSEMQKLLLIEQAYAANARVVTTVQAMLDILMEI